MKKCYFTAILALFSCVQKQQVHPPVGGALDANDMQVSKTRAKNLNLLERKQIQDWINSQPIKFYPMGLNYWIDVPDLQKSVRRQDGTVVSYSYELYDFDMTKLYDQPVKKVGAIFGKFEDIKAVEDALRYLPSGSVATLLVPSVLAYGTYGDNNQIPNDMPLIIKLKVL